MKLQPLQDRVIVKHLKADDKTAGGLYIPDSAKEKEQQGQIIAVAEGITSVKAGDKVIYAQYGGTQITIDNEEFTILDIKDVLALIR